jgi:Na+/H+-dicarboxylate symporter
MIVSIALGLGLGLIGLGVLGMLISGIQSMIKGKQDIKKVITMVVPFVVFGIAYGIAGTLTEAAMGTMLFMIAAMLLLIFLTGLRGTFNI